jgi:antitoxin MazE
VKAKLVRIGNSRGIRLARPLRQETGLTDEADIQAGPGVLPKTLVASRRVGWAEAAAAVEPEALLEEPSSTRCDDQEWVW